MVHVGRLTVLSRVNSNCPAISLPLKAASLFCGRSDEDGSVPHAPLLPHFLDDIVLPLFVVELVDRDVVQFCLDPNRFSTSSVTCPFSNSGTLGIPGSLRISAAGCLSV